MLHTVVAAILNLETLVFTYEGYHHMVEPHAVGLGENGRNLLLAYETGSAASHMAPKLFRVTDMENLAPGRPFHSPRMDYVAPVGLFRMVYASVPCANPQSVQNSGTPGTAVNMHPDAAPAVVHKFCGQV